MVTANFTSHTSGKTFNVTGGDDVTVFELGLASPKFFDMLEDEDVTAISMSGETTFSFADMLHPMHEIAGFAQVLRIDGPNSSTPGKFIFKIINPSSGTNRTVSFNTAIPNLNSDQFFITTTVNMWGWIKNLAGSSIDEIEGNGTWINRVSFELPIGTELASSDKSFEMTNDPTGGFDGFKVGTSGVSQGAMWIDEADDLIHWVDRNQIEHTIKKAGGSLTATGSDAGQIYMDTTLPRLGYISNEKRFLTVTALLETDSIQAGLPILRQNNLEVGYIHVTGKSVSDRRHGWIQITAEQASAAIDSNHLLGDGSEF